MTLQVFGPPINKHKLTKSQFQQERYPSSGSTQKDPNRKTQGKKNPRLKQRCQLSK